jgi:group I intron endonuclease
MFYIYCIFNNLNGKIYIGKSKNPNKRWFRHITTAFSKKAKDKFAIHLAIKKYNLNNFTFSILQSFNKEKDCFNAEIYWIKYFNSKEFGYNLTDGGEGCSGKIISEKTRTKIRQKAMGRKHSTKTINKISKDNNHRSKLNFIKVKEIRNKYNLNKYRIIDLSKEYNVSSKCIAHIIYNECWIDENYIAPIPRKGNYCYRKLIEEDVCNIREMLSLNIEEVIIAKKFNITKENVYLIRDNKIWRNNGV